MSAAISQAYQLLALSDGVTLSAVAFPLFRIAAVTARAAPVIALEIKTSKHNNNMFAVMQQRSQKGYSALTLMSHKVT